MAKNEINVVNGLKIRFTLEWTFFPNVPPRAPVSILPSCMARPCHCFVSIVRLFLWRIPSQLCKRCAELRPELKNCCHTCRGRGMERAVFWGRLVNAMLEGEITNCIYRSEGHKYGCLFKGPYERIAMAHETKCASRHVSCPEGVRNKGKCEWKGSLLGLCEHWREKKCLTVSWVMKILKGSDFCLFCKNVCKKYARPFPAPNHSSLFTRIRRQEVDASTTSSQKK